MSSFFFNIMLLLLFLHLVVGWINQIIFNLKFMLIHIPMFIFVLCFIWILIWCTQPFRNKLTWSLRYPFYLLLIINSICQCVKKTIPTWVWKVLNIAKGHMSQGVFWGATATAALVAGEFLVSIQCNGYWTRIYRWVDYHMWQMVVWILAQCWWAPTKGSLELHT